MIINTKFEIGQKVWFKSEGKEPFEGVVSNITVDVSKKKEKKIEYWAEIQEGRWLIFDECETFATKEEAINGLTEKLLPPPAPECTGMSKRFYAACAAMQGMISNKIEMKHFRQSANNKGVSIIEAIAIIAYAYADELLKQENQ